MAAIVATAPPLAPASFATLRLRILSALVLAPLALAAAWLGPPLLSLVVAAVAAGMAWEWSRLCHGEGHPGHALLTIAAVLVGVVAATIDRPLFGIAGVLLAALLVALAGSGRIAARLLAAAGLPWIGIPCIALLWLARDPVSGRATVLWILAVVWATDIGAFAAGRSLGGPRLAPRISPHKTWSGLAGGVLCAAVVGAASALLFDGVGASRLALASGLLAIVEQAGDLGESLVKRHFGVKDASSLIPGHGGLLDRLDGMLAVVPAVALFSLFEGGGVLTWR